MGCSTAARWLLLGCVLALPAGAARAQTEGMRTFDCVDPTPLFHLLCRSADAAKADWELNAAKNARAFSLPEAQRRSFDWRERKWQASVARRCALHAGSSADGKAARCVIAEFSGRARALRAELPAEAQEEAALTPEQRAAIQRELIERGLLDGVPDGQFGASTRAAIRRFQTLQSAPASAFLTGEQRAVLLGRDAPHSPDLAAAAPAAVEAPAAQPAPSPLADPVTTQSTGGTSTTPSPAAKVEEPRAPAEPPPSAVAPAEPANRSADSLLHAQAAQAERQPAAGPARTITAEDPAEPLRNLVAELRREIRLRNIVIAALVVVCGALCLVGVLAGRLRRTARALRGA
jgi:uncharacterized protein YecT (DUF1311 family)